MEDLLHKLEQQIREMLSHHSALKHSNQELRQGKHALSHKNEALMAKQQKAISQIEILVSRLKSIERIP